MQFNDRTVVVTGASAGLGMAMAHGFAAEGARVAVLGTNPERTAQASAAIVAGGGVAAPFVVDIADAAAVTDCFAAIVETLGDIDVLINNAAYVYGDIMSLMRIDLAVLDRVLAVNVLGPLHCARAAHASMRRRGGGSIVNISSVSSYLPSGGYGLSKAAVNNLTIALAAELAPDGIRVNGIAPGRIESAVTDRAVPEAVRSAFVEAQLVKRPGSEADVVEAALYLASPAAGFVIAQTLLLDGGYLAYSPKVATGATGIKTGTPS